MTEPEDPGYSPVAEVDEFEVTVTPEGIYSLVGEDVLSEEAVLKALDSQHHKGGITLDELGWALLFEESKIKSLLEGLIKEGRVFFTQSTGKYNLVSPFDEFDGVL